MNKGIHLDDRPQLDESRLKLLNSINEIIVNVKALTTIAIGCNLQNVESTTLHDYFNAMNHLLTKAENVCDELVNSFCLVPKK